MRTLVKAAVLILLAAFLPEPLRAADAASWEAVDKALGRPGKASPGGVQRYSWPRTDLAVSIGDVKVEAPLALGSWAGFVGTTAQGEAMAMGDLVLLSSEVDPVIRALQAGGLDVFAVHNHLTGESPAIVYVHFGGHGSPERMATALKAALDTTKTPLAPPSASPAAGEKNAAFDEIQSALGRQGTMAGRVLQISVPRASKIEEHGVEVPASLGMSTALNFQAVGAQVATTGDFVLVASEVNPVIRELQAHGIRVTALHSHMLEETPRLFFMHFWGVGSPDQIGAGLKAALSKVAVRKD